MENARRVLLALSTISFLVVFGGVCTYWIFRLLPGPLDWIVAVPWLFYVLLQPAVYFRDGGEEADERYIQTGKLKGE